MKRVPWLAVAVVGAAAIGAGWSVLSAAEEGPVGEAESDPVGKAGAKQPASDEPRGATGGAPATPVAVRDECRLPSKAARQTVRERLDLRYGGGRRGELRLDLALPPESHNGRGSNATGSRPPLVVLIHGGGWRAGERAHMHREMRMLAVEGYAAASLDYRLVEGKQSTFPGAVSDVRCAVRWLRDNAARLGFDGDRIAAAGTSAGGHLAGLLATAPERQALDDRCPLAGDVSPKVQAAVAYFAPFDLRSTANMKGGTVRIVARFLGVQPADDPDRAALASPIVHVDPDDPPMLLVHGTDDATVDVRQSRKMQRTLRRSGVPVTYVEIAGEGHAFPFLGGRPAVRAAACTTLAFLGEVL